MPESQREVQALLALSQAERPKRVRRLLAHFGSAQEALAATNWTAAVGANASEQRPTPADFAWAAEQWQRLCAAGGRCLSPADADYPPLLGQIAAPPPVLFALGPDGLVPPTIAIVGSRKASDSGKLIAAELARGLVAQGICIVSGMAFGIDAAAHQAALAAGGRTIAVLGCGADVPYPRTHTPTLPPNPRARSYRLRVCLGGAARAGGLPTPQPHHQRAKLGGGHRRGPAKERRTDHSPTRPRSKPRGICRTRRCALGPQRGLPPAHQRRSEVGRERGGCARRIDHVGGTAPAKRTRTHARSSPRGRERLCPTLAPTPAH